VRVIAAARARMTPPNRRRVSCRVAHLADYAPVICQRMWFDRPSRPSGRTDNVQTSLLHYRPARASWKPIRRRAFHSVHTALLRPYYAQEHDNRRCTTAADLGESGLLSRFIEPVAISSQDLSDRCARIFQFRSPTSGTAVYQHRKNGSIVESLGPALCIGDKGVHVRRSRLHPRGRDLPLTNFPSPMIEFDRRWRA